MPQRFDYFDIYTIFVSKKVLLNCNVMGLNMQVLATDDGSSTLVSMHFDGQLYHSSRGAIGESQHVYIDFLEANARVLEIGFGSGLNALLSFQSGLPLRYTTIELYPVSSEVVERLSYVDDTLRAMHRAEWGKWVDIADDFALRKLNLDFTALDAIPDEKFDIVFFDAFAPDIVPEQWSVEVFTRIGSRLERGGFLLTYSAKGDVKRALRSAGFEVKRLPGALGKHNMLKAIKL